MNRELDRPAVPPDFVEEYFDELEFLWPMRETILSAADWTIPDLAQLEQRAEAHRDALRLAGRCATEPATARLVDEAPGRATVAAFVLIDSGDPTLAGAVMRAIVDAPPVAARGIARALAHCEIANLAPGLLDLVASAPAAAACSLADALTFRRIGAMPRLPEGVDDARALADRARALGRMHRMTVKELEQCLRRPERDVRRAALEAAARSDVANLVDLCRARANGSSADPEAVRFLGAVGDDGDVELLTRAIDATPLAFEAVRALGASGRSKAAERLVELVGDRRLGAHAVIALRRLCGAPGALAVDGESDSEALEATPQEAADVRRFWESNKARFDPALRWQMGHDVSNGVGATEFASLPLGTRRDLWLGSLVRRHAAAKRFEPDELATRQFLAD